MDVMLNGQLVPEAEAKVSVFDRGFLYGDGLFETIRVSHGQPFRWADHLARLRRGADFLKLKLPFDDRALRDQARRLIEKNQMPESLLRLTLSRGVGVRGYSPHGADQPLLVMTLHSTPDHEGQPPLWRAVTSSFRLPAGEPLAEFKTCNKLPQILARAEAESRGADEALLLNTRGELVEAAAANLFWVRDDAVCSPPLTAGILGGVTRLVVLEICRELNIVARETTVTPAELRQAAGAFVSLSSWGVVELVSLDGQQLPRSPLVKKIQIAYRGHLHSDNSEKL
jgi:aminodeoxychorismate lyase